jgi:hypothetical protein
VSRETGAPGAPQRGAESRRAGEQRVPAGGTWERIPEVATTLESPATEVETDTNGSKDKPNPGVPKGNEITSEMSLDKIRRDLEALDDEGGKNR